MDNTVFDHEEQYMHPTEFFDEAYGITIDSLTSDKVYNEQAQPEGEGDDSFLVDASNSRGEVYTPTALETLSSAEAPPPH